MCEATKAIGEEIRKARKNKKLTQQELSERVGISRNYLADIEGGRYTPSVDKLLQISRALDIDLNLFKDKFIS